MLKPIVFWGASGHAKVLREFIGAIGYRLVAVFDNDPQTPPPFPDVPLYYQKAGFLEWLKGRPDAEVWCLVAIGGGRGAARVEIQSLLEAHSLRPALAIHPTAFVAGNATVGPGCQVLAQAAVCPEVRLGRATIVNTAASVDHECQIGEGVHIAPGARLAGCVQIGDASFVGIGAIVLPRIRVGRNAIVGAGAVVTRDVPDGAVVLGNPARVVRKNDQEFPNAKH